MQVDKVLEKIRDERYRYFGSDLTLFPTEARRYTPEVNRELLHNAIAHQDCRLSGKINVLEYEDRLVFKNEGSFIPESIEAVIENGYKPPYYRNPLLASAMSKTGMIDQNAIGIRNVFDIQRLRLLPMPTYDLAERDRVSVTVYGDALDEAYTRLLAADSDLELGAVLLLDMVQKGASHIEGAGEGPARHGPRRGQVSEPFALARDRCGDGQPHGVREEEGS